METETAVIESGATEVNTEEVERAEIIDVCQRETAGGQSDEEESKGERVEVMNSKKEFMQPGAIRPKFAGLFSSESWGPSGTRTHQGV